ncbi:MAG: UDP-glucose 6-dehydrogenase [Microbacteriaceae bacterium]|jgi:hypothetical protein|nr:UDP-glucose 6-dehydrogenase [Microbacteriaceae bacterium]
MEDVVAGSDALLVLTEWAESVEVDLAIVNSPVVVDARDCLYGDAWRSVGRNYRALALPASASEPSVALTAGPVRTLVGGR